MVSEFSNFSIFHNAEFITTEILIEMLQEQLQVQEENHKKQFDVLMAPVQQNSLNFVLFILFYFFI